MTQRQELARAYALWKCAEIARDKAIFGSAPRRRLARAADHALDRLIALVKQIAPAADLRATPCTVWIESYLSNEKQGDAA